ncbi:hypothetical protein B0A55_05621 [Friedmanniomyces simplex]|uniref:Uncharacterized protein n=1 Tax=Friedmanniomyces simplex TaxID=329884 RepID=A0A4U0XAJ5_9PEZI|nr:hypothetical protein B0A55_05621 [Friedmanniomyces simplex]
MEKLILRSVMYGADRIPDSWFEKVPGGFYKAEKEGRAAAAKAQGKRDSKNSGGGGGSGSRPGTSDSRNGGGGSGGRSRRYSTGDGRGDDGKRSGGPPPLRRREGDRGRQRESYDGMEEDGGYYSGDEWRRRRNHGSTRQRRWSFEDDHEYKYETGPPPSRDDRRDERRMNDGAPYPERDSGPPSRAHPSQYAPALGAAALTGAAIGLADGASQPYSDPASPIPQSAQPAPASRNGVTGGYVPYAHIYGQPAPPTQRDPMLPPPLLPQVIAPKTPGTTPATTTAMMTATTIAAGPIPSPHRLNAVTLAETTIHPLTTPAPKTTAAPVLSDVLAPRTRSERNPKAEEEEEEELVEEAEAIVPSALSLADSTRYLPPGYQADNAASSTATPTMKPVDPRKPLGAQTGGGSGGGGGSGREDDRAHKPFGGGDGAHGSRPTSGYYSN